MGDIQSTPIDPIKNRIKQWNNEEPAMYALDLIERLGPPTGIGKDFISWNNEMLPKPYTEVKVIDEYVFHNFPGNHYDFVYTSAKIKLTPDQACKLIKSSSSIIPDLLRNIVTARCGGLTKNDVTLAYAYDVGNGLKNPGREEYAKRIRNNKFRDPFILNKIIF